jgi:hypothetical protein
VRRLLAAIAVLALALTACGDVDTDVSPDDDITDDPNPVADGAPPSGTLTLSVGDATYDVDLDECFMTEDGIEARGVSEAGETLEVEFFRDDPGSSRIYVATTEGEALWSSDSASEAAPEFEVDEEGFRATGRFTGRDGGIEDGELSGTC